MVDLQYISFSTKQSSTQSLFFGPKQCSAGQVNSLYFTNNKRPPPPPMEHLQGAKHSRRQFTCFFNLRHNSRMC